MSLNIMFHDDWEIYGDGTGDPQTLMFEPAKRNLDICDQYGAKFTFYAEIGQQLHMLDTPGKKWKQYASTWESLLKDAIQRGHDVQLHFHPQWIGAELKNGAWHLDHSKWSAGNAEHEHLDEWIGKGKRYLESLLQSVRKDYKVLSFRAGGWLCQPSMGLYHAFKNHDIVCDVTVMKGRYAQFDDGSCIDFRDAVSRYEPWEVNPDNFAQEQNGSGVWELPVFTEESNLPQQIYLLKKAFRPLYYYNIYKKRKLNRGGGDYSPKIVKNGKSKEYYGSFGYIHYKHLLSYVNHVQKAAENKKNQHLILLTHSKSFLSYVNFGRLLNNLYKKHNIVFSTTQHYIEKILEK